MAYHNRNTPPKHVQKLMNSSYPSDQENSIVFKNESVLIIQKEYYKALYIGGKESDHYITLRDCSDDDAIKIAKGLSELNKNNNINYDK